MVGDISTQNVGDDCQGVCGVLRCLTIQDDELIRARSYDSR